MDYWTKRGFSLKGTRHVGTYIASKPGKHAVLVTNFFDELTHDGEWFYSEAQAVEAANEMLLVR